MPAKLQTAVFQFIEGDREITVRFDGDEVIVWKHGKNKRLPNKLGRWGGRPYKPRVADCLGAIAAAAPKKRVPAKPLSVFG